MLAGSQDKDAFQDFEGAVERILNTIGMGGTIAHHTDSQRPTVNDDNISHFLVIR